MAGENDSPLEFPCRWPVKAMVTAGEDSLREVLSVIARHAELPEDQDVKIRPSRHGRYESITVVVEAQSRRHLEILYTEIRALDAVKMTL
ncbi:YbeD family protein [Wenzhouxiangella sp. EGI_FJ10305]|uniref:YbeD family protein n=1 Tax=Wenzhouxiangella sp. EGI_FJ10305 TaxID=3243768 RepID=UPI0035D7DA09